MALLGPFSMTITSGSSTSVVVSGSALDAGESMTLFSPSTISGSTAILQGAPDLGVAVPIFRDLAVVDGTTAPPVPITVAVDDAVIVRPVPAVAGFRMFTAEVQPAEIDFELLGRVAPGVNASDQTVVTGSVEVVAEPSTVTRSVTIDAQPVDVTGSLGFVTDIVQPISGGFIIEGQTADVTINDPIFVSSSVPLSISGSVVVSDISQAEPVNVTGSVETTGAGVSTQSVSIVESLVTQSVDVVSGDSIQIEATGTLVTGNPDPETAAGVSPGGVPIVTFASMSRILP